MSSRLDKHLSLNGLKDKVSTLIEEIKESDKFDFGSIDSQDKTAKHGQILQINRLFNQAKRELLSREKSAIDDSLVALVRQITAANNGDVLKTKALLSQVNNSVNTSADPVDHSHDTPVEPTTNPSDSTDLIQ